MRVLAAHEGGQEGSITMTTRKRHTPEQVVRTLVEADRLLAGGAEVLTAEEGPMMIGMTNRAKKKLLLSTISS